MQSLHNAALNRKLYYVELFLWHRAEEYHNLTLFFIGLFSKLSFESFQNQHLSFSLKSHLQMQELVQTYTRTYIYI